MCKVFIEKKKEKKREKAERLREICHHSASANSRRVFYTKQPQTRSKTSIHTLL